MIAMETGRWDEAGESARKLRRTLMRLHEAMDKRSPREDARLAAAIELAQEVGDAGAAHGVRADLSTAG